MTTPLGPDDSQGPSTFRSRLQQYRQDPRIQQAAQDVSAAHPQGEFLRTPRMAAGALGAGYRIGKEDAASFGGSSQSAVGNWGSGAGNGGDDEFATKGDVNEAASGLHDRLGNIESGMQNAGGVMDRNAAFGQGMGTAPAPQAAGTQRPNAPSPLTADFAAQRMAQQQYQAGVHDSIESGRASLRQRAANYAARVPGAVQQTGSGIGASAGQNEQTMGGILPVQNGMSDSTYSNKRFRGQQS